MSFRKTRRLSNAQQPGVSDGMKWLAGAGTSFVVIASPVLYGFGAPEEKAIMPTVDLDSLIRDELDYFDCDEHPYLYEAFICSSMWRGAKPPEFQLMGPGERTKT